MNDEYETPPTAKYISLHIFSADPQQLAHVADVLARVCTSLMLDGVDVGMRFGVPEIIDEDEHAHDEPTD